MLVIANRVFHFKPEYTLSMNFCLLMKMIMENSRIDDEIYNKPKGEKKINSLGGLPSKMSNM